MPDANTTTHPLPPLPCVTALFIAVVIGVYEEPPHELLITSALPYSQAQAIEVAAQSEFIPAVLVLVCIGIILQLGATPLVPITLSFIAPIIPAHGVP